MHYFSSYLEKLIWLPKVHYPQYYLEQCRQPVEPVDPENNSKISTKVHYISPFFALYFSVIFSSYWDDEYRRRGENTVAGREQAHCSRWSKYRKKI